MARDQRLCRYVWRNVYRPSKGNKKYVQIISHDGCITRGNEGQCDRIAKYLGKHGIVSNQEVFSKPPIDFTNHVGLSKRSWADKQPVPMYGDGVDIAMLNMLQELFRSLDNPLKFTTESSQTMLVSLAFDGKSINPAGFEWNGCIYGVIPKITQEEARDWILDPPSMGRVLKEQFENGQRH